MNIVALQVEHLKRILVVNINPNGSLVEITGKNGQGKTSVLDAIAWAIEGTSHIQAQPIRKGWNEALIRLDLSDGQQHLRVTRKFKAKEEGGYTTSITVENAEGARFPKPQEMLDALVGQLAFDPLAFTRLKAKDQLEQLKRLAPGVDWDGIEAAQKKDFDERTGVNRRAKELRAQAEGVAVPAGPPPEEVDESALVAELERAGEHNADVERRKGNREQARRDIEDLKAKSDAKAADEKNLEAEVGRLNARRKALLVEAKGFAEEALQLEAKLATAGDLPAPIDTSAVRAKIDAARQANAGATAHKRKAEILAQATAVEARAAELTKALDDRAAAKAKAIAEAKLPVAGIGFGEDGVLLDGLPFDQASDAQQLRASIAIAAAMNPKLKVIRVRDGSLLDEESMALLGTFAEEHGMQVWVETVSSGRPAAFVLEDGRIKGAAPAAATVAAE